MRIFHADIVYSGGWDELIVHRDSYIAVEGGAVEGIYGELPEKYVGAPLTDYGSGVIIPAFSDLHVHAPQYPQRSRAMDLLLRDWQIACALSQEARYAEPEFAAAMYEAFLNRLIKNGTFHACVYGTIHRESTSYLLERMESLKLRAYVGKVNMDIQSPADLRETVEDSLRGTEVFLERYSANRYAKPIITPRFAPACSFGLLKGLGQLGHKYHVGLQTQLVESGWEAAEAVRLNPDCSCDTQIYEKAGLLENGPVVAAHFVCPSDEDIRLLKRYDGYAVQCPYATLKVIAEIMRTAFLSDAGIRLALGSDISSGRLSGVYAQVPRSMQLSKQLTFFDSEEDRPITFANAFCMATKQGGALFGKVGSLEPGCEFDALVIRDFSDPSRKLAPEETVEQFCRTGKPADILAGYIHGESVKAGRA